MLIDSFLHKLTSYYYNIHDIKTKYKRLRNLFYDVVDTATEQEAIGFANRYTRIRHIYDKCDKVSPELKSALAKMERNAREVIGKNGKVTQQELDFDVSAIARFVIAITGEMPTGPFAELVNKMIPPAVQPRKKRERLHKVRIVVSRVTETHIYGYEADGDTETLIKARHSVGGVNDKITVSPALFTKGAIVNLIDCTIESNGDLTPQLIILSPDYLLDCSSLAESCKDYGFSPFNYLFSRVKQDNVTSPILLGNIANYYHDAFIYGGAGIEYAKTTNDAFCTMPIELTACKKLNQAGRDGTTFFQQTRQQFDNIGNIVNNVFPTLGIDKDCAMLEPAFICEDIGMQGRLDFLHIKNGNNIVIEMKSGKVFPESPDTVSLNHRCQAFLYQIMIQKTIGVPFHDLSTYIFYSRYSDSSLRKVYPSMDSLRRILNLRNLIVALEYRIASTYTAKQTKELFDNISPEQMIANYNPQRLGKLLRDYIVPQIEEFRKGLDMLPLLEQKYIYSFANFIYREQMYAKVGGVSGLINIGGFSSCWNSSLDEKMEAGSILYGLMLKETEGDENGVNRIVFQIPKAHKEYLANFRKGDTAILYIRNNDEDLMTNKEVLKCAIAEISEKEVAVSLRQSQKNISMLNKINLYALEPDYMDSSFTSLLRNVFGLAKTDSQRRDLILGKRLPTANPAELRTKIENEDVRRIVSKAKSADGYFLLIGPPGTGKTSITLRDMVKEFYAEGNNLLLLAYTNRAVDEICSSVESAGLDFIRIGHHLNCAEEFHKNLLAERIKECKSRSAVEETIKRNKIFIATTTTINGKRSLYDIVNFDVAIIDEASQILEPQICGVLSASDSECHLAIKKFIMIGDHKQLPAVVMQSPMESKVRKEDAELYEIGLTDRRNSLFERLYKLNREAGNECAYDMLTRQGRMHRDIASFANREFYAGKLKCVPLEHQECPLEYKKYNAYDAEETMIATKRVAFIASEKSPYIDNIKTNPDEAETVVRLVIKAMSLMQANGIEFTEKSIGVITNYRSQIALIRSRLEQYKTDTNKITIDTVERYQGSQRDIIIYSVCVNEYRQMMQLCNIMEEDGMQIDRKMNVALTRARKQMFIIGCREILMRNAIWARLIESMQ